MRDSRHTTAAALCMTVFEQMRDLIAVFAVDGHFQCVAVFLCFLRCPASFVSTGLHRGFCGDLIFDGSRSFADCLFHSGICKISVFLQSLHDLRSHIVNRCHPLIPPFVIRRSASYSPASDNSAQCP